MRKSALFLFGLVVTCLVALGLVVLASAGEANSVRLHGNAYHFITFQSVFIAVGIAVAVVVASIDYHIWRDRPWLTVILLAVVLVLLGLVFLFPKVNGSYRWMRVGPLRVQPSEFAKLATVVVMAVWIDLSGWRIELFKRGAFMPACLLGLIILPVLCEPDFGSVMVIAGAGCLLLFVGGTRILHMLPFILLGAVGVGLKLVTNANRMARLFDEEKQYQVKMALAALARGGLTGVGLGESMQKQLYLPEAHTDFIFAVGAEEMGIGFSIAVLLLFLAFFVLAVYIAKNAEDRFGRLLAIGMTFVVFFQAMFNLGVVCKAFPTKGMALPFFSYGGTNMLSVMIAVGMILSVGIHSYAVKKHALGRKVLMRGK